MPFKQHVVIVCVFVFMCARRFLATRQAAHAIQAAWRQLQLRRQLHARLAEEREKERAARQEQEQFVSLRKQYGCVTGLSCCWCVCVCVCVCVCGFVSVVLEERDKACCKAGAVQLQEPV